MLQSLQVKNWADGLRLGNFRDAAKNNLAYMQEMVKTIKLYNKVMLFFLHLYL